MLCCSCPEDSVIHAFVLLGSCELPRTPSDCVRHILHQTAQGCHRHVNGATAQPLPSTPLSLTRCCTSTCVSRAPSRLPPLPALVKQKKKKKSCQGRIYNVEVNKPPLLGLTRDLPPQQQRVPATFCLHP